MTPAILGFIIGALFGAALLVGGLADPDKIVGTLRLKDFHALRTIAVFVLVGMLGVWILDLLGYANFSIKPAALVSNAVGGALLGIGFGLTGYCPGTGLACAAAGRADAMVSVLGMAAGALAFILIYPCVAVPLDQVANYGKAVLPASTGLPRGVWVIVLCVGGGLALGLTARKKTPPPPAPETEQEETP
jgi:uncharacterized membrane protein YedE/YeeE